METVALVEQVRFDALFTFIFSPRPGTPAAKMPDPVHPGARSRSGSTGCCDAQNGISAGDPRRLCGQNPAGAWWTARATTAAGR